MKESWWREANINTSTYNLAAHSIPFLFCKQSKICRATPPDASLDTPGRPRLPLRIRVSPPRQQRTTMSCSEGGDLCSPNSVIHPAKSSMLPTTPFSASLHLAWSVIIQFALTCGVIHVQVYQSFLQHVSCINLFAELLRHSVQGNTRHQPRIIILPWK